MKIIIMDLRYISAVYDAAYWFKVNWSFDVLSFVFQDLEKK